MCRNQYKGTLQGVEASEPYARGYADRAARFGCRTREGTLQGATSVEAVITHQRAGWLPSTEEKKSGWTHFYCLDNIFSVHLGK